MPLSGYNVINSNTDNTNNNILCISLSIPPIHTYTIDFTKINMKRWPVVDINNSV